METRKYSYIIYILAGIRGDSKEAVESVGDDRRRNGDGSQGFKL